MSSISISLADISFRVKGKRLLYKWIRSVITSEKKVPGELVIILCSDDYLLDINKRFLDHDFYTDIITFDYTEGLVVSGEMYISVDRIRENASQYRATVLEELNRVIIHGTLHLCGYKDKTDNDLKRMRSKENEKLKMLGQ